jgi:hypothetical protein
MVYQLENLGRVNEGHRGYQELFKRGDAYIVVSTVDDVAVSDPAGRAIQQLAGALGGYATDGEETMAFLADEDGNITDWAEIAVSVGPGSRQDVLDDLAES